METSTLPQSTPDRYARVASPIHTIVVLAVLGGWAFQAKIFMDKLGAATDPHRLRTYFFSICLEWLVFLLVLAGVRWSGASMLIVLGDHWHSLRAVLRDIGVAAGFWVVAAVVLWTSSKLLGISALPRNMEVLMPHGPAELTLWVVLSVTAGICEETIFRGYLQRQFMALTNNAPAGILLSAAAFGAAHAYQGFRRVILIGVFGAMFGILAYWRRSVRPGMIAHAWQDTLGGVVGSLMRH
jgi:hypothetical protein